MSKPSTILLAASYNLMITAFDLQTSAPICEFEIQNTQANKIVTCADHRFYAASYSYVFAYDFYSKAKKSTQAVVAHEGNVTDLIIQNNIFLTCGDDKKVKIWDRRSAQNTVAITTKNQDNAMVFIPAINQVIAGDENGSVTSYDIRNSNLIKTLKVDEGPIRKMALAPDENSFLVAAQSGITRSYKVSDTEAFTEAYRIQAHNDFQLGCAYSPNGKLFATSSANNTTRIWSAANGDLKQTIVPSEMREWIWDVAFTPDSTQLVAGGTDGVCKAYDVDNGRILMAFPQIDKCISAIGILSV